MVMVFGISSFRLSGVYGVDRLMVEWGNLFYVRLKEKDTSFVREAIVEVGTGWKSGAWWWMTRRRSESLGRALIVFALGPRSSHRQVYYETWS